MLLVYKQCIIGSLIWLGYFGVVLQMSPPRNQVEDPTVMNVICQFNKLKPPKFQGGTDPLKYDEWIRKLENLFEIMECPDQYKVALVIYQFEGEVEYWWGIVRLRGEEDPMT